MCIFIHVQVCKVDGLVHTLALKINTDCASAPGHIERGAKNGEGDGKKTFSPAVLARNIRAPHSHNLPPPQWLLSTLVMGAVS